MTRKQIVVVGSSFAGFTAALELKRRLGRDHDVTVISKSDEFLFVPSLVWVAFGVRGKEDVTFAIRPMLEEHGIEFVHEEVLRLHLDERLVATRDSQYHYDYLVLATGPKPNYAAIPGLGPRGYTQSILSLKDAERARSAFDELLAAPGPVVVGSVQGATCHVAASEFLFTMASQMRDRGLPQRASLTYLTAEMSLAHLGTAGRDCAAIGDAFLDQLGITVVTGAVRQIRPGAIDLVDGRTLPFAYAMLIPPFLGVDAVRACDRITNASGFVNVDDFGRTSSYPEVFAAGSAVAVEPQWRNYATWDGGQTDSFGERMGRRVAHNIAALIRGSAMTDQLLPRPGAAAPPARPMQRGESCAESSSCSQPPMARRG